MSDSPSVVPDADLAARPPWRMLVLGALRVAGSVVGLVAIYYLLPLDRWSSGAAVTVLVIGLVAFVALVTYQVRAIIQSPFPGLRAVEALAASVPLFLLLFAGTYVVMAHLSDASFGEHLSHTDGLYFTVTVFATVGFGDITAKSESARLLVTCQMVADLVVLGVAVKIILGAITRGRQRRPSHPNDAPPTD